MSHSREAFYKECVGKFFWTVFFQRDDFRRAEARCCTDAERNRRLSGKGNNIIGRLEGELREFCSPLEVCCVAEGALLEKRGLIFDKMEVFARLVH